MVTCSGCGRQNKSWRCLSCENRERWKDPAYRAMMKAAVTTHGLKESPEYRSWSQARGRCTNPKLRNYHAYGGRGIKMCAAWATSFEQFYRDMGPRPSIKHSLDRIDPNGDYQPSNCRWATLEVQANNTRTNRHVTFRGETKTIAEWARGLGIKASTLQNRLHVQGLSPEAAFTLTPKARRQQLGLLRELTFNGETLPISHWAQRLGISPSALTLRLQSGWPLDRALTTPKRHRGRNG
jgi:hypothetical protein